MMKSLRFEKDIIIAESIINYLGNLFIMKKENIAIKNRIFRKIRNLSKHAEENHYTPGRVGDFWNKNCNEYERNGDRDKTLSVEEYLNKIRPYLKDIINDLRKFHTSKIQLPIAINFMSSKGNDRECMMHSKTNKIEIMINGKADEVIEITFAITSFLESN